MRWQDHRLSRLEMVFAIIVLLIILSALLNRAVYWFAFAERALVQNVVTNINAALRLKQAEYIARGKQNRIPALAGSNPIELVGGKPADNTMSADRIMSDTKMDTPPLRGYLGERAGPEPGEYPRGAWYFDTGDNVLVYIVRNRELFRSNLPGTARIRFRVELDYTDRNGNGKYDSDADAYSGVSLEALDDYQWLL